MALVLSEDRLPATAGAHAMTFSRSLDFAPTIPLPDAADRAGDSEDPHLAGVAAQTRYLEQCRRDGQAPQTTALDLAYWDAYRGASQCGGL